MWKNTLARPILGLDAIKSKNMKDDEGMTAGANEQRKFALKTPMNLELRHIQFLDFVAPKMPIIQMTAGDTIGSPPFCRTIQ